MVQLVIKHPSPQTEDYRVEFDLSKTIGDLKEHLALNYPAKPLPTQQKLIFAGKLLQNEIVLADLFKQYDTSSPQIIHIVFARSQPISQQPIQQDAPQQPQVLPQFQFQQQGQFNPMFQQIPNQHQFFGQQVPDPRFQGPMWNQGQYMGPVNAPVQQPQQPQPMYNPQPQQRQNEGDGFYLILKLALMVYIFSQGGTTTKTIILCFGALFIYLYQTGRLRVFVNVQQYPAVEAQRRQQQANNPPVNNPEQPNNQPANEQPQNNEQDIPQPVQPVQPVTNNTRIGFIDEIAAIVLPFFYSISPTYQPQPINEAPRVQQDVMGQRN